MLATEYKMGVSNLIFVVNLIPAFYKSPPEFGIRMDVGRLITSGIVHRVALIHPFENSTKEIMNIFVARVD